MPLALPRIFFARGNGKTIAQFGMPPGAFRYGTSGTGIESLVRLLTVARKCAVRDQSDRPKAAS